MTPTYTLNGTSDGYIVTGKSGSGDCTIPSTYLGLPVVEIADEVFRNSSVLTTVSIPSSVTRIGGSAFAHCPNLTSINIPASVTTINVQAFEGDAALTSVMFSTGGALTTLERTVFYGCGFTSFTVPAGVTSVGETALAGCTNLVSVSLPAGLLSIGSESIAYCPALTTINIPSSVTSINVWAFADDAALANISCTGGYYINGTYYLNSSATTLDSTGNGTWNGTVYINGVSQTPPAPGLPLDEAITIGQLCTRNGVTWICIEVGPPAVWNVVPEPVVTIAQVAALSIALGRR